MKATSIEAVRKAAVKAGGEDTKPFTVLISDIRRDPTCQPREGLNSANLTKLAGLYKAGTKVDPIVVAFRGEELVPVIVDGHHRHRVLERIGAEFIDVIAATMSHADAEWRAVETNDRHGLPLNKRERRARFKLLIERREHLVRGGYDRQGQAIGVQFKSYADLAALVGVSKSTVRNWMEKDFPDTFRKMGGHDEFEGEGGTPPAPKNFAAELEVVRQALVKLRKAFDSAPDHATRDEMLTLTANMLARLRAQHEADDMISVRWDPPITTEDHGVF